MERIWKRGIYQFSDNRTTLSNSRRCQTTEYLNFLLFYKSTSFKISFSPNSPLQFTLQNITQNSLFLHVNCLPTSLEVHGVAGEAHTCK